MGFQEQTKETWTSWLLAIFHLHPADCVGTGPSETLRGCGHVRAMGRVISPGQDSIRTSVPRAHLSSSLAVLVAWRNLSYSLRGLGLLWALGPEALHLQDPRVLWEPLFTVICKSVFSRPPAPWALPPHDCPPSPTRTIRATSSVPICKCPSPFLPAHADSQAGLSSPLSEQAGRIPKLFSIQAHPLPSHSSPGCATTLWGRLPPILGAGTQIKYFLVGWESGLCVRIRASLRCNQGCRGDFVWERDRPF